MEEPDLSVFEVPDYVIDAFGDDRYIAGTTGGITALTQLGGTETGLMLYATDPDLIHAFNRRQVAAQNTLDEYYIRKGTPGVLIEQDMAGSNGPLISPEMFREMCFPYLRERIGNVKNYGRQVVFHNCGYNIPLMDMFIDTGIDCYQSLQTTAGMEVGRLKELYGDRLCFWGGIPVELLIDGEPDDIRKAVGIALERGAGGASRMAAGGADAANADGEQVAGGAAGTPGTGFILGPSHSVAMNTRYENFMAMLEEHDRLADRYV